ncbi:hypothetical protein DPMN_129429 [Dreissena polymorpha]|uniref:Uncharacterized protein n=1 Tax=Dreissena polymorpha TaxID=45954 RepID=A0A9D4JY89_DREPO|nr:hypothetical protein DPMN_129429 [Dreissena polymorpha]
MLFTGSFHDCLHGSRIAENQSYRPHPEAKVVPNPRPKSLEPYAIPRGLRERKVDLCHTSFVETE